MFNKVKKLLTNCQDLSTISLNVYKIYSYFIAIQPELCNCINLRILCNILK